MLGLTTLSLSYLYLVLIYIQISHSSFLGDKLPPFYRRRFTRFPARRRSFWRATTTPAPRYEIATSSEVAKAKTIYDYWATEPPTTEAPQSIWSKSWKVIHKPYRPFVVISGISRSAYDILTTHLKANDDVELNRRTSQYTTHSFTNSATYTPTVNPTYVTTTYNPSPSYRPYYRRYYGPYWRPYFNHRPYPYNPYYNRKPNFRNSRPTYTRTTTTSPSCLMADGETIFDMEKMQFASGHDPAINFSYLKRPESGKLFSTVEYKDGKMVIPKDGILITSRPYRRRYYNPYYRRYNRPYYGPRNYGRYTYRPVHSQRTLSTQLTTTAATTPGQTNVFSTTKKMIFDFTKPILSTTKKMIIDFTKPTMSTTQKMISSSTKPSILSTTKPILPYTKPSQTENLFSSVTENEESISMAQLIPVDYTRETIEMEFESC